MHLWKIDEKDIGDIFKLVKELLYCFLILGSSSSYAQQDYIWLGGNKPNERSP